MRHFVHSADGQKYGPADLSLLIQWKNEGRLIPETLLEPEVGGNPFPAKTLPGLFSPLAPQYDSVQPGLYNQPVPAGQTQGNTQGFVIGAFVLGAISICFCWILLGPASIYCANRAKSLGYPGGTGLMVYSITMTIIAALVNIIGTIYLLQSGELFKGLN